MVTKTHFLFATDSYHLKYIKTQEMLIGGNSEKIILASPSTRKLYDFKMFLANDDSNMEWSIGSFNAGENREGSADRRKAAHQLHSSNGEVSWNPALINTIIIK